MGIPAYFRWISEKYPRMMVDCVEVVDFDEASGTEYPIDASATNPNGVEFDHLYLDMNGIIHPCTHPEDRPAPTTEQEMFDAVFDYIDRIFAIVRPRKVLYMAIDGVAPRAKINQQRSRRFRAAKEAEDKIRTATELKSEWTEMGLKVKEEPEEKPAAFDSNVITPGTPFMERLAIALREFVARRIASTPGWHDLRVIFSDASVPGEGEHKIAEFIRLERAMPGYDPSIRHVMYGLDADLIMLALATHELYFTILREEVFPSRGAPRMGQNERQGGPNGNNNGPQSSLPAPPTQIDAAMIAAAKEKGLHGNLRSRAELGGRKPFHFLHVNILREYLDYEYRTDIERELAACPDTDIAYDLENVLNDFILICFFVGNDFLPHLPTLDIREGAIDFLIELYKTELPRIGYLTSGCGDIDFTRLRKLLVRVGEKEDEIFKERSNREIQSLERAAKDRQVRRDAKERQQAQNLEVNEAKKRRKEGATGKVVKRGKVEKSKSYVQVDGNAEKHVVEVAKVEVVEEEEEEEPLVELSRRDKNARIGTSLKANLAAGAAIRAKLAIKKTTKKAKPVALSSPKPSTKLSPAAKPFVPDSKPAPGPSSAGDVIDGDEDSEMKPVVEKTPTEFAVAVKERVREKGEIENPFDDVRLGEEGWKARYYRQKFNWGPNDIKPKQRLLHSYLEGLHWVMKYYYVGCLSWVWYYPYHYAPFASDLVECDTTADKIALEEGKPFRPFTQLQAVMPASSGKLVLPKCYSDLMTDPDSPIIDYYPDRFEIDLNGKRFEWQGVALLPFIDERRLENALADLGPLLTKEEQKRNSFGKCSLMVHRDSDIGLWRLNEEAGSEAVSKGGSLTEISSEVAKRYFFGQLSTPEQGYGGEKAIVLTLTFQTPAYRPHISAILPGGVIPPPVLNDATRAESRRNGWKPARFGSLGRAAKELVDDRDRRFGRGGGRGRNRGGRGGYGQYPRGGGVGGYGGVGHGYVSGVPVINGPPHPSTSEMFGGLGAQQPSWMRHQPPQTAYGGYQQPTQYQNQSYSYQQEQHYQGYNTQYSSQRGGRGGAQQPAWRQGGYQGVQRTAGYGGYGGAYSQQQPQQGYYDSSSGYGGGYAGQGFNPSQGGYSGAPGDASVGSGSGLTGPTAASMRHGGAPTYGGSESAGGGRGGVGGRGFSHRGGRGR